MSFKFKESCGGGTVGIDAASGWNSRECHSWHG